MGLLLAAEDAAARHPEVMELNWLPAVTSLVVFLLAFGFLYLKVWPTIIKALDERQAKIRQEIESAEKARLQARAALAQYEQELANARQEAGRVIASAKADAKAAAAELRATNEAHIAEMKQRALHELESARRAAVSELHAEAAGLAADIAARILKREITPQDQQRLVDESLEELAGGRRR
jgi:F-type H+-transporting ATPase subunit b